MTKDKVKSLPLSQKKQREQRLASSLRANLHRRKSQSRRRKAAGDEKGDNQNG
jgi:hypothetical protein